MEVSVRVCEGVEVIVSEIEGARLVGVGVRVSGNESAC